MSTILDTIKSREEEFEKTLCLKIFDKECVQDSYAIIDIRSFHKDSMIAVLEAEVEWLRKRKKNSNPSCDCGSTIKFHSPRCQATILNKEPLEAFNQALDQTISHLESVITELKKV